MSDFVLAPADADKDFLLRTARGAVADGLAGREAHPAAPPPECSAVPQMELGAFVTLELDGVLRGCIGQLTGSGPLYVTVARMAQAAAFGDSRFAPLTAAEAGRVTYCVSVMGPVTPCPDPALIETGRHGLVVRRGAHAGLLLPQVAAEHGWNRETFLEHTCRKAGLAPDAWRSAGTQIFWFEAVIIR
ncbi:AmmeMemoRadiSam system protein A [Oleidesulfovibrio alaskensis]|jgi:AmmeMemoRadiSam system protein A